MKNFAEALDYEIVLSENYKEILVWTPDETGAVIGSGKTREEAVINAVGALGATIASLLELIKKGHLEEKP